MVENEDAILKKKEYEAFVGAISEGNVGHWVEIARALNVSDDTITAWKKLPEAKAAIQKGIDESLEGMKNAGVKDWRMHEAKLKMFGINPATKIEATIDDPRLKILERYGLPYAGKAETVKGRPPKDTT